MAVRIPTYQERQSPSGYSPIPQARAPQMASLNFERVGQAFDTLATTVARVDEQNRLVLQKKADDDAIAAAGKIVSDATLHWDQYLRDASQQAKDGAAGFTPKVLDEFDYYANQTLNGVTNEKARQWAQGHLLSLRTNIGSRAIAFEAQAGVAERDANLETTYQNLARLAAQDQSQYDVGRQILLSTIANLGYTPMERATRAKGYLERYAEAAMTAAVQSNPEAARSAADMTAAMRNPAGAGFERAVAFTLQHEGGFNPRDSNGAPAKFGINQAANPGVNLETLTEQGARDIYRQRYWAAIGGDALAAKNPALAMVAFDTAVIAGPGRANKMLADSGGDPVKFMALREQFLADLVKRDPGKYGAYEKAWTTRNAALRNEITGASAQASPIGRMAGDIDVNRLPQFASAAQTEMNRQQATYRAQITTVENDHVAAWMNGDPVQKPLSEADYVKAYGPIDGQQRYANYRNVSMMGADIQQMKLAPDQTLQETVNKYRPQPGAPGYELSLKRYEMMTKAADTIRKERQSDPMAFAQQNKIGDVKPLDFNDQKAFGAELTKRSGVASSMQQTYGTPLALLSAPEAKVLNEGFQRMTTQQRLAYLETINRSVTDPTAYRAVMQQVAPDSPVTAMAGMILNKQSSTRRTSWFSADQVFASKDVAAIVLEGEALLNPNKASREADGRGREFPMPKEQELRDLFTREVGKAFAGDANGANFAFQAVKAYYAGQAARDGDITGAIDSTRMKAAITAVVGGVTDINGKGEVVRPWGMTEALFKNTVRAKFDAAIAANGYKGSQLDVFDAYGLQSAGDARYLVRTGSGYMTDRSGNPIVLDLSTPPPAPIPVDPRMRTPAAAGQPGAATNPAQPAAAQQAQAAAPGAQASTIVLEAGQRAEASVNDRGNQYSVGIGTAPETRAGAPVIEQYGSGRTDPVTATRSAEPPKTETVRVPPFTVTRQAPTADGASTQAVGSSTPAAPARADAASQNATASKPANTLWSAETVKKFSDFAAIESTLATMRDSPDEVYSTSYETLNKQLVVGARTLAKLRADRDAAISRKDTAKAAQHQEAINQLSNLWHAGEAAIQDYVERTQDMIDGYKQEAKDAPNQEARTEAQNNVKYYQDVLKRLGVRENQDRRRTRPQQR